MRNLADLVCSTCGREFYGDLPAGQALYTPLLLEKKTGVVHDPYGIDWFAEWLSGSYAARKDYPIPFAAHERLPITKHVVLLNCLDTIYGHCLLKLLNAQHYIDRRPDVDLIVMVPSLLEWMIPDGVAQAWVVDLPLQRGTEWNDWLAREIRRRLQQFTTSSLSVAFSHPHPDDFDIERFTRVKPFALDEWSTDIRRPSVTFIWREDRLWSNVRQPQARGLEKIKRQFTLEARPVKIQAELLVTLAEALRQEWQDVDFAVAGLGRSEKLPDWIKDLRQQEVNTDIERQWCTRYGASHIVVGVHGSNMILPSAHAASVVELIGEDRWGNFLQDLLFRPGDTREMFFRYRFLETNVTAPGLARLLTSMLRGLPKFRYLMDPRFCKHGID
ncbi:MAG: hypothetical protein ND895_10110 [Pyrinomonadaceae bacterium]|nr:hypothetical protein [Pyrinomonadaceae bacterium]